MSRDKSEYKKAWYQANKEQHSARMKAWREANKEKLRAWYEANKEKEKERRKAWREANKEKIQTYQKAWKNANRERIAAYDEANKERRAKYASDWNQKNKEKIYTRSRAYRLSNKGRFVAYTQKRVAAKLNRTPCWLTETDFEKIERKYANAQRRTDSTGEKWVVDHIIPLRGRLVSGLHVPTNLRVVKNTTNCRKSNHFDIDKEWALS